MSKWVISIAMMVLLSVSSPALTAQTASVTAKVSTPATVKLELSWQQPSGSVIYEATGQSLGTLVGPNLILTHNHFSAPLSSMSAGRLTITDQTDRSARWSTTDVQLIIMDKGTTLIWLPVDLSTPTAPLIENATLQRLSVGSWLSVNYWDDADKRLAQRDFQIIQIQDDIARLADPDLVINSGDSGGGAYFNGKLVGNTWSINLDSFQQAAGSFNVALMPQQVRSYVK